MIKGKSDKAYQGVCAAVAIIFALICLYPLLYTVFLSFCTEKEWLSSSGAIWYFTKSPTGAAYVHIIGYTGVVHSGHWDSFESTVLG